MKIERAALPRIASRVLLLLAAVALAAPASSGSPRPAPLDDFPILRLAQADSRLDPLVYRSSQPDAGQFRGLVERYGVRSVIKLNAGKDPAPAEVSVSCHPLDSYDELPHDEVEAILDQIDRAPRPVLIHCKKGKDRTGLIVALWRIRHGVAADEAYADMRDNGFKQLPGLWSAWLRETAPKPAIATPVADAAPAATLLADRP